MTQQSSLMHVDPLPLFFPSPCFIFLFAIGDVVQDVEDVFPDDGEESNQTQSVSERSNDVQA